MPQYALLQKSKVVSGAGCVAQLADAVKESGYEKPFVVYDAGIRDCGIADKVLAVLKDAGIECVTFDRTVPDPPDDIVNAAADECKEAGCDCVIAIGGGSVIDTAKGVTVLRHNPGKILDYATPDAQMVQSPGLISVPTTSGTGSELSNGIIITNHETGDKMPMVGDKAMSEIVFLDAELTIGMPKGLTIMTGLDVFSHAWEAYTTILATPAVGPICEKAMEDVIEFLPRAVADGTDVEARERMLVAASLGGWMLFNDCAHVGHSLAHVIGAGFHMPHGAACAYSCPTALKFVAEARPEKIKRVGQILGVEFSGDETPAEIGEKTAAAYIAFRDDVLGMKPLADMNIAVEDAVALAPKIPVEVFAGLTPRAVTEEDAVAMLTEIFS